MIGGVYSDDNNLQLEATTQFRKLLSIGEFLHFIVHVLRLLLLCG